MRTDMHSMGVFDLPAPFLGRIDASASALAPSWLRLVIWGALAAVISMLLYRWLSPQKDIHAGKAELRQAQARLSAFDGAFNDAWPLMRHMLKTAWLQVVRVGGPAIVASIPLLFLLSWMGTTYGYHYPPNGEIVRAHVDPDRFKATWMPAALHAGPVGKPRLVVADEMNRILMDAPLKAPVPVIYKYRWWNALFGNPVGYLPEQLPVKSVQADLPRQQHISFGPRWLRGWEFLFFASLLAMSITLKKILRIA